jgi:phosphatidylglycerophosphatase A
VAGHAYFHCLYARSSSVFGAVPSLHVAYPLLVLLFGWPRFRWLGRVLASLFFACMCFAAVYGALPLYLLARPFGPWAIAALGVVVAIVGVWASSVVVARTGSADPQIVVIDEVAGVLFALAASPLTVAGATFAVVAFRLFDWLKPWPAYVAERAPRGWGVMLDDVVAGGWGALAVALLSGLAAR